MHHAGIFTILVFTDFDVDDVSLLSLSFLPPPPKGH